MASAPQTRDHTLNGRGYVARLATARNSRGLVSSGVKKFRPGRGLHPRIRLAKLSLRRAELRKANFDGAAHQRTSRAAFITGFIDEPRGSLVPTPDSLEMGRAIKSSIGPSSVCEINTREEKTMSKFARQVTRLAKPRMSRVAKPRGIPRLGAAPTAPRLGVPRAPAAPRPAGMPRGIPRRRRR